MESKVIKAKYKLSFFWSGHFGPDMEKIKQLSECFKDRNTFGNIGNAVKVLVGTQSTRENLRLWTKARLTGYFFEVFGIIVVVGITRVIYFQFLEYEGYYLTKNWFVRASLGYLNELKKPEFSQQIKKKIVMTNFCLDFCTFKKFQSCQFFSPRLDLLMRPAGIFCQWTQILVTRIYRTSFQSSKIHEFRNKRK